jgi:hypothetical protein
MLRQICVAAPRLTLYDFAQKVSYAENISRAKAQRKPLETRQRFAPLRLCARNILATGASQCALSVFVQRPCFIFRTLLRFSVSAFTNLID